MSKKAETVVSRRGFLRGAGLASMTAALGTGIPFGKYMPVGLIPVALAQGDEAPRISGKFGLSVLNDYPAIAETPAHLLDDRVTPTNRLFVRNHGVPPYTDDLDPLAWLLEIEGESCLRPATMTLGEIQQRFKHYTLQLQLECGGNGRTGFHPPVRGIQWTTGAIGCPEWTGVRLRDVLDYCGIAKDAVYIAYEGDDTHLSGDLTRVPISRGVPVSKAMQKESMLVWAMNGESLPPVHGFPLRLLCAGWPASVSGKWLRRLMIRDRVHDGAGMAGQWYRLPCKPVAPGSEVADADTCIIESMPVKSLITFPRSGIDYPLDRRLHVRGHAWAGDLEVSSVFISIDFGATWQKTKLRKPANRLAWQQWSTDVEFPQDGYYEIWARAVDENGRSQPVVVPAWNPRGYLNNTCHRIAVSVRA